MVTIRTNSRKKDLKKISLLLSQGFTAKTLQVRGKKVVKWGGPITSFKPNTNGVKLEFKNRLGKH
jgi:hypothetical protein